MILRKQKIICDPWNLVLSVKFQERIQGLIKHDGACLRKYLTIVTRLLFSKKKNYFIDNTRQVPKYTPEPFLWFKKFTTKLLCWLMISRFTRRFSKKTFWWLLLKYFQALVVIYSKEPSIYYVRKISTSLTIHLLLTPLIHTICSRIRG